MRVIWMFEKRDATCEGEEEEAFIVNQAPQLIDVWFTRVSTSTLCIQLAYVVLNKSGEHAVYMTGLNLTRGKRVLRKTCKVGTITLQMAMKQPPRPW